jgi:hypothetical protein
LTDERRTGNRSTFFDGELLKPSDLDSEQRYRRRLPLLLAGVGLAVTFVSVRRRLASPAKISGPDLNGKGNEVGVENVELAGEGLETEPDDGV